MAPNKEIVIARFEAKVAFNLSRALLLIIQKMKGMDDAATNAFMRSAEEAAAMEIEEEYPGVPITWFPVRK